MTDKGIDISSWQKRLNLSAAEIDFAILKISEGRSWADPCFDSFYSAAKCPVGAYVFSYATTPEAAVAEAEYALSLLNGRALPLGLYMDVEAREQLGITNMQLTAAVAAFCDTVRRAGYAPGVYGSELGVWTKIDRDAIGADVLAWVANWSRQPVCACDIWQTSDSGAAIGYDGPVDLDTALSDRVRELIRAGIVSAAPAQPAPSAAPDAFDLHGVPALKAGASGDRVKVLQGELITLGYDCGGRTYFGVEKADGIFGAKTDAAVRSFQKKHHLPESGIADQATRAAILGAAE